MWHITRDRCRAGDLMDAVIEDAAIGAGVDNLMGAVSGAVAVIFLDAVIRAAAVIFLDVAIEDAAPVI